MQKIKSMKLMRCVEHMSFIYAQGLRLALYKGLHATAARLVQKVVAGTGSGNRALRVKLTKMLNVPGVAHRNAIFGLTLALPYGNRHVGEVEEVEKAVGE